MHCQNSSWLKSVALILTAPAVLAALVGCPPAPPDDPTEPQPLPVTIEPDGSGTVTQAFDGDMVTLTAQADEGWVFERWSGTNVPDGSVDPSLTVSRNDVSSVTAHFAEDGTEPAPDSDGDGVEDAVDECPNTPEGATVDEVGCSDADGDGVVDGVDECADTPPGTTVNASGCPDEDGDGVADDADDCPDTPAGAEVDADGCADSQLDADNDGVFDDVDECPNTPTHLTVDEVGCPISVPGTPDSDDDGVPDDVDQCADTPADTPVDANGCPDADEDGIADDDDECPDTPAGAEVNAEGCAESQLDTDSDGVTDDLDECPNTTRGTTVDETGCPVGGGGGGGGGGGTTPVCGDGVVDTGEECDDGNTSNGDGCSASCTWELNDDCSAPRPITRGTISFENTGATTDGPEEPGILCALNGYTQIGADVWFCFTSPCTDTVVVSGCGSSFDTKIAVYEGCDCPTEESIACSDDDCGPGTGSRATFPATTGNSYLIRVGGYESDQGTGTLSVFCESDPGVGMNACGEDAGDCAEFNGTPGCSDEPCCITTCDVDPFCCDTEWDSICAEKATEVLCRDTPPDTCGTGAGDCTDPRGNGTPGCEDLTCCETVCRNDPYCCLTEWDDLCASDAEFYCQ